MFAGAKRFDPTAQEDVAAKRQKIEEEVKDVDMGEQNVKVDDGYANDRKRKAVLEKFHAVMGSKLQAQRNEHEDEEEGGEEEEEVEQHGLVPMPVPKQEAAVKAINTKMPNWLTEPVYVPVERTCPFTEFTLSERMLGVLKSQGYDSAFAIQTAVFPEMIKDSKQLSPDPLQDILVNAYTGSGKTLAYGVPIVEGLSKRAIPRIRALVVLPTKPLIQQVRQVIETLSKGTSLSALMLRADRPFKDEQKLLATSTPDILITTPGRLVDHIRNTEHFTLEHLRYFVIDEADRLLNQNFQEWVDVVMKALPQRKEDQSAQWFRPVQKLIFSATLTRDPGKLASLNTHDPRIFIVGVNDTVDYEFSVPQELSEKLVHVQDTSNKPLLLLQLLRTHGITSNALIFVKSNETAGRLARLLSLIDQFVYSGQLVIERCSGELDLKQRKKVLRQFGQGEIGILVCTDLVARGIDISSIQYVINYDLPIGKREYVHRVGRTARAGNQGTAYNLVSSKGERKHFWSISKSIYRPGNVEVETEKVDPDDDGDEVQDGYKRALDQLQEEVFNRT